MASEVLEGQVLIDRAAFDRAYEAWRDELTEDSWDGTPWAPMGSERLFQMICSLASEEPPGLQNSDTPPR